MLEAGVRSHEPRWRRRVRVVPAERDRRGALADCDLDLDPANDALGALSRMVATRACGTAIAIARQTRPLSSTPTSKTRCHSGP